MMKRNIIYTVTLLFSILTISQNVLSYSNNNLFLADYIVNSSNDTNYNGQSVFDSIYNSNRTPMPVDPNALHQIIVKFNDNSLSEQSKEDIRKNLKTSLSLELLDKLRDIKSISAEVWQLGLNDDRSISIDKLKKSQFFEYIDANDLSYIASPEPQTYKIVFKINNSFFLVNGTKKEIDPGRLKTPQIVNRRTVLPIRAFIESIGGSIELIEKESKVIIKYKNNNLEIVIDRNSAIVNGELIPMEIAPLIINGRTMIPLRFLAENFGFNVQWVPETQEIVIQ